MTVAEVIPQVKALLDPVADGGPVAEYPFRSILPVAGEVNLVDQYAIGGGRVRGWWIDAVDDSPEQHMGVIERVLPIDLVGVFGHAEGETSWASVRTVVEDVIQAFAAASARRLGGTVDYTDAPRVVSKEQRYVNISRQRVRCHVVTIRIVAHAEETIGV